jgi:hypothetical protein
MGGGWRTIRRELGNQRVAAFEAVPPEDYTFK